ncbi:MAG: serine/threonine protein kinase, partial [Deltaproteobacteria bacterium]
MVTDLTARRFPITRCDHVSVTHIANSAHGERRRAVAAIGAGRSGLGVSCGMHSEDGTLVIPPTTGAEEPDTRPPRAAPPVLAGRYRLGRRIGKGGMGEVIAARDEQVGRDVAIKRMRAASPGDRAIRRFLREASIQGRLEHPAIVPVHELGRDDDGLPFFVMKKLSGTTLGKMLGEPAARTQAGQQRLLRAFAEVCLAVELAHVRGIVHRDLKPDNILLGDFGEVYILDWGVAKVIGDDDDGEFADLGSGSGRHGTAAGTAIGTPGYMAPEQAFGIPDIDGRADIYSLGCVLFEILTGEPLHARGETTQRTTIERVARPSQRAVGRSIPPELDELCAGATAGDRNQRIATARDLGDRVQRYLDGDRDLALPAQHRDARGRRRAGARPRARRRRRAGRPAHARPAAHHAARGRRGDGRRRDPHRARRRARRAVGAVRVPGVHAAAVVDRAARIGPRRRAHRRAAAQRCAVPARLPRRAPQAGPGHRRQHDHHRGAVPDVLAAPGRARRGLGAVDGDDPHAAAVVGRLGRLGRHAVPHRGDGSARARAHRRAEPDGLGRRR